MEKTERFNMALTPEDKATLQRLANRERLPAAAVIRRLIWDAMQAGAPAAQGGYTTPTKSMAGGEPCRE